MYVCISSLKCMKCNCYQPLPCISGRLQCLVVSSVCVFVANPLHNAIYPE